jgi:RNA polymerase sigma factor (sigma-70 family)
VGNDRNMALGEFLKLWNDHEAAGKSDGQLLSQFINHRDEEAFGALMRRHSRMIIAVCRRILGNAADADDAFQATFLVFVRNAKSLKSRALLGDWLHGVARRTALKVMRDAARRRTKEQAMVRSEAQGEEAHDDWLPLLDEELSRLPEKYRLPIILCDLEGRTRQEAARQLDWPEGTVAGRLARGREMLHKRLLRRGVTLSLATLSAVLTQKTALATLPATLVSSTIKAAALVAVGQIAAEGVISAKVATLTGEVMKTMLLTKLKTIAAIVVVCAFGGFGWVALGGTGKELGGMLITKNALGAVPHTDTIEDKKPEPDEKEINEDPPTVPFIKEHSQRIIPVLREMMDIKNFTTEMSLQEFFGLLSLICKSNYQKDISFLIDNKAFQEDHPDGAKFKVTEITIKFSPYPNVMSTATAIQMAINQIPDQKAQILIRDNMVFITTQRHASLEYLLKEKVFANYVDRPFNEVVDNLSGLTGISINIDPLVEEKAKKKINAGFRNDVTLEGALRIVTEMAGLKIVDMQSGLYITTPERAKELEKELRAVKK